MVLVDATTGASLITAVTGVITDNMAGILLLLGTFVGIGFARKFLNKSVKGKI